MPFLNTILSIVFPVRCIGCGTSDSYFCIECVRETPAAERESAEWIFPIFDYRHPPIKKALSLFKYKNKRGFAGIFAEILYGKITEELSELSVMKNFRDPLLIPIPLSSKRYRERGYNQAELICKELIKLSKANHLTPPLAPLSLPRRGAGGEVSSLNEIFTLESNVLIKPKETEHQARIRNRSERLKNIVGSFAIQPGGGDMIKSRNIILIDDILTTGATLTEAKKILKQAGARKIIAFTVAH